LPSTSAQSQCLAVEASAAANSHAPRKSKIAMSLALLIHVLQEAYSLNI
jgi:hypothetical protein